MNNNTPEMTLVRRLLAHDEKAFKEFFETYFDRLYRFALQRLNGDREATRDVAQVALTKAIRRIESFRGEAGLFTWLCTICRNEISDYCRREAKHAGTVELTEDRGDVRAALESLDGFEAGDPQLQYGHTQKARVIQVALDKLPSQYGNALEWKYIYGYSTKEIAGRLGVGTEAAQSLLARARRAFHDAYTVLTDSLTPTGGATQNYSGEKL